MLDEIKRECLKDAVEVVKEFKDEIKLFFLSCYKLYEVSYKEGILSREDDTWNVSGDEIILKVSSIYSDYYWGKNAEEHIVNEFYMTEKNLTQLEKYKYFCISYVFSSFYTYDKFATIGPETIFNALPVVPREFKDEIISYVKKNTCEDRIRFVSSEEGNEGYKIAGTKIVKYYGNQKNIIIPDGITLIAHGAFRNLEELETVYIPDSVVEIGNDNFTQCTNLTKIRMSENIESTGICGLDAFPWHFVDFTQQKNIILRDEFVLSKNGKKLISCTKPDETICNVPDGIEIISDSVFMYSSTLEKLVLPESIKQISKNAFAGCWSLTKENITAPAWIDFDLLQDGEMLVKAQAIDIEMQEKISGLLSQNKKQYLEDFCACLQLFFNLVPNQAEKLFQAMDNGLRGDVKDGFKTFNKDELLDRVFNLIKTEVSMELEDSLNKANDIDEKILLLKNDHFYTEMCNLLENKLTEMQSEENLFNAKTVSCIFSDFARHGEVAGTYELYSFVEKNYPEYVSSLRKTFLGVKDVINLDDETLKKITLACGMRICIASILSSDAMVRDKIKNSIGDYSHEWEREIENECERNIGLCESAQKEFVKKCYELNDNSIIELPNLW